MPSSLLGQPDSNAQRPFTDPAQISGLHADRRRIERRSNALLSAKTHGLHVGETAADLLASAILPAKRYDVGAPVVADIGCGNGRPTRALLTRFPQARFLAVDASAMMLGQARAHLAPNRPLESGGLRPQSHLGTGFCGGGVRQCVGADERHHQ
ncbi:class I SAM-dependent methyltransferase [Spirillospora sp. CA-108201]